ncbi:MAG: hypothetical protein V4669_07185 [Pseudomonadota bacterium]
MFHLRFKEMMGFAGRMRGCAVILTLCLGAFAAGAADQPAAFTVPVPVEPAISLQQGLVEPPRKADFGPTTPSSQAREVADWVLQSGDHKNLPFMVIDKLQARVFVFQPDGKLRGTTSALLGVAIGDHTVPGIGQKKLSAIKPEERTTPAGRFMASLAKDIHGIEVLWVDYESALSLHRVVKGTPKERRAERLASASVADKRITYGCINVPVPFYEQVVSPMFKGTYGVVYVLPETKPLRDVFGFQTVQGPAAVAGSN